MSGRTPGCLTYDGVANILKLFVVEDLRIVVGLKIMSDARHLIDACMSKSSIAKNRVIDEWQRGKR